MKASPLHPNFEAGNYCAYEFDPHADFNQFLEQAKNHAYAENFKKAVPPHLGEARKADLQGERRKKKSWKSSLFSWLKMDKKNQSIVEESLDVSTIHPKVRRGGIFSGPIQGSAVRITSRSRKPTSGPLPSLFNPSSREEDEIVPYMCLNQLENPHSYGPVYLVT